MEINLEVQEFILLFSTYLSCIFVSLSVLAEICTLDKLMLSPNCVISLSRFFIKIKKASLKEQYNYRQD